MYSFSIHHHLAGVHVHVNLFVGQGPDANSITRARSGSLVFLEDEFKIFVDILKRGMPEEANCHLINVLTGEVRTFTRMRFTEPSTAIYGTADGDGSGPKSKPSERPEDWNCTGQPAPWKPADGQW